MDKDALQKHGVQPLARELAAIDGIDSRARLCAAFGEIGQLWVTTPFANSVLNDPDRPSEYAADSHHTPDHVSRPGTTPQ